MARNEQAMAEQLPTTTVASLQDITKAFLGKQILRGVSFTANRQHITLITGASGSGKSTALRILAGIDHPDSGKVQLFGEDVTNISDKERRKINAQRVGLGFQTPNLLGNLTVIDNLVGLAEANGHCIDNQRVAEITSRLGLGDKLFESTAVLSGGEKLLVSLGRAVMATPELLLLDEPTHMIDPDGKQKVFNVLREFSEDDSTSIIMVSHDAEARSVADREIRIHSGEVISDELL